MPDFFSRCLPVKLLAMLVISSSFLQSSCSFQKTRVENSNLSGGSVAPNRIQLEVLVAKYIHQGMHDDFSSGISKSYDLTIFEVINPEDLRGTRLTVMHEVSPEGDSIWTDVGKVCFVNIYEWIARGSVSGITQNLVEVVEDSCRAVDREYENKEEQQGS